MTRRTKEVFISQNVKKSDFKMNDKLLANSRPSEVCKLAIVTFNEYIIISCPLMGNESITSVCSQRYPWFLFFIKDSHALLSVFDSSTEMHMIYLHHPPCDETTG